MTLDELHRTVVDGLRTADARFVQIDERFGHVDTEFGKVRQEMRELRTELLARIQEDGETTRRHFNVMVERVEAAVRIVADVTAHHATVLGSHEIRLQAIEKRE
jgi:hypothetical protein